MRLPAPGGQTIYLKDLQALPGGDFIIGGNTILTNGEEVGLIIRMNSFGSLVAQQQLRVNNQSVSLSNIKVLLDGSLAVGGMFRNGTNNVFVAHLRNDLTINWSQSFSLPSLPKKVTLDLYDKTSIALAIQLTTSVVYTTLTVNGAVNWSREVTIQGLDEVVGFSNMNWLPMAIVSNCLRNGKRTVEMIEIDKGNGTVVSTHTLDNGIEETRCFGMSCFNERLSLLYATKTSNNQYKLIRTIGYSSASAETKHSYSLAGITDFGISGAMNAAADALGFTLPQDGKLIFIRQFSYYYTLPEYTRQYNVPVGASLSAITRSFDGGYLFGLNTKDSNALLLIKTDSTGVLAGCGYSDLDNKFQEQINVSHFASSSTAVPFSLTSSTAIIHLSGSSLEPQFSCKETYCPPQPVEDSCLSTFYKTFRSNSYIDAFSEYHLMRNNRHLVVSSRYDRILGGGNQVVTGLKTFTEKGDFIKGYNFYLNGVPAGFSTRKVTDSTIMLISYSTNNNIPQYTFTLVTDDLQTLWSKSIQTYSGYEFGTAGGLFADVHRDAEGNYYFIGTSLGFNQDPGVLVYKMDGGGNMVWLKAYSIASGGIFGTAKAVTTPSSLIVLIEGSGQGSVSVRLDKRTGQMLNSYKYQNYWAGSVYNRLAQFEDNRIYYAGNDGNSRFAMATFDTLGRPIRLKVIENSEILRAGAVRDGMLYAFYKYYNGSQYKD
ncbi:MAG: hypothetical protein ICV79_22035, partial [Flavisolibacter sp.]|nr:hypothetical protein [Flavisolibacter sp.]